MVQKRGTRAINKLCVREILGLSFVYGAYFFEFRGWKLVCFGIAYNFDGGRHWQIRRKQGRYACALLFSRVSGLTGRISVGSAPVLVCLSVYSRNSAPSALVLSLTSPHFISLCSWHPLRPKCWVLLFNHKVLNNDSGDEKPKRFWS